MAERELFGIKPLAWEDRSDKFGHQEHVSNAGFAVYWVRQATIASSTGNHTEWMRGGHGFRFAQCASLEDGKAACEAHWRERIKACLVDLWATGEVEEREIERRECPLCGGMIGSYEECTAGCPAEETRTRPDGSIRLRRYRMTTITEMLSEEVP